MPYDHPARPNRTYGDPSRPEWAPTWPAVLPKDPKPRRQALEARFAALRAEAKHLVAGSDLPRRERLVLLQLVDHCRDPETLACFPSHGRIAFMLDWGPNGDRKVKRALPKLKADGWIDWRRGTKGYANRYVLNWPRFEAAWAERAERERTWKLGRAVEADMRDAEAEANRPTGRKCPPQQDTVGCPPQQDTVGCPPNPVGMNPQIDKPVPLRGRALEESRGATVEDFSLASDDDAEHDGDHPAPVPTATAETAFQGETGQPAEPPDRRQRNLLLPIRGQRRPPGNARHAAEAQWSRLVAQKAPHLLEHLSAELYDRATDAEAQKPRGGHTGFNLVMAELKALAAA